MANYTVGPVPLPSRPLDDYTLVSDASPLPVRSGTNRTAVSDSAASAAAAGVAATLAGAVGKTTFISGFVVTGAGATGASVVEVTVTGVAGVGTLRFKLAVPAGAAVGLTPLVVTFNEPLAANAPNTAIVVTVPSLGAGNTAVAVAAWGFQQ